MKKNCLVLEDDPAQKLRESERMLGTLMDNLPGMVYRCQNDRNWTMAFVGGGCRDLTGYEASDLIGNERLCFSSLIHPDDRKHVWDRIQEALAERRRFQVEYRIQTASGKGKWVWEQGVGVFSEAGELLALEGFITDITRHKQAEEALGRANDALEMEVKRRTFELQKANERLKREIEERKQAEAAIKVSEVKYRSLFETSRDGLVFVNMDGQIEEANQAYLDMFGYSRDEMKSKNRRELTPQKWHEFENTEIIEKQVLKRDYSDLYEKEYIRRDGSIFPVSVRIWLVRDDEGNPRQLFGMVRDITEKKLLQAHIIRSERLAATGQLAASIAHEINSPLQGIAALLNLIRKACVKISDSEVLENLDLVKSASENIRDTVQKLLELNRPAQGKRQRVSVNKVIDDTVVLLRNYLQRNKVRVKLNLSPAIPAIKASPRQLGQVLINLVNNAVEAMSGRSGNGGWRKKADIGGEINISTDWEGENVVIKFCDTGGGISDKDLHHIFDPFYTGKKTMGMGIGLSVCHEIIKEHNGAIMAANSPEGGAVFTIQLPAASETKKSA